MSRSFIDCKLFSRASRRCEARLKYSHVSVCEKKTSREEPKSIVVSSSSHDSPIQARSYTARYSSCHTDKRVAQSLWKSRASCYLPQLRSAPSQGLIPFEFRRDLWRQKTRVPGISCDIICVILYLAVFTARRYANRGKMLSSCVCVCVSVTLRYCIKTAKRRITQTTLHDSPMTLVFWHQSSRRNSNGITPYRGDKCRWGGLKLATFDKKRAITRKRYKIDA